MVKTMSAVTYEYVTADILINKTSNYISNLLGWLHNNYN
jgi:hypothetical protein